jgi:hypothetical protein
MKAIAVVAHPDDCVIFAYSFIDKYSDLDWTICYLTYDSESPRGDEFKRFWQKRKVNTVFLGHEDNWRDIENKTISFDTSQARHDIQNLIRDFDIVLTHNAEGEYGHLHHVFVHQCCAVHSNLVTFASYQNGTERHTVPAGSYRLDEFPYHRDIVETFHREHHTSEYQVPPHVKSMLENRTVNKRMKKLMIAGCSFSAPSTTMPGTSWGEILADKLGWEVVNLARQGCSNGGIRIQIDEIRRQRPDFAIITPTMWDRIEIPAKAAEYDWENNEINGWNPPLQQHLRDTTIKNGYDRADGINNVNYGHNNSNMICETIFSLAQNQTHAQYRPAKINKLTQTAVKHYIDGMYDSNWKKQMDEWIITEGILQMYLDELNFLVQPVLLWPFDPKRQYQWRSAFPRIIPDRYVMFNEPESVLPICGNNPPDGEDPGYHSNLRGQKIIANNWYRRITEDFGLR